MPEMQFVVRWPDETVTACYSPSLVIRDYLAPGTAYALDEFVTRSRTALTIASERVAEKYGFACTRALGTLSEIEARAAGFAALPDPRVTVTAFLPPD